MTSKAGTQAARTRQQSEIVVNFDPEKLSAPFVLRCGALLIDYIVFLIVPVSAMLLGRYFGNDGARLIGSSLSDSGWLIAILIGGTNFLLLPAFSGQSIGKMITGIKIVRSDGRQAGVGRIALRNILGYILTLASFGIGFLMSVLSGSGRTLHDYLFGTVVIYAERKLR
jgi:uncharacterized RDD family membrane protein YckC